MESIMDQLTSDNVCHGLAAMAGDTQFRNDILASLTEIQRDANPVVQLLVRLLYAICAEQVADPRWFVMSVAYLSDALTRS